MEPISAAASVVTLIQLTYKISSLCLDIHSDIKSARLDILRLSDEVKSLRALLEGAAGLASSESLRGTPRLPQLDDLAKAGGVLARCKTELLELQGWLQTVLRASIQSRLGAVQWTWKKKDVIRRSESIFRIKSCLQLALSLDQTTVLLETHMNVLSLQNTIGDASREELRRSIVEWFAVPHHSRGLDDARKLRSPTTGKWFLTGSIFNDWKSTPGSVLWLHGIPGSGKTVLSSSIEELLNTKQTRDPGVTLHHFFDFSTQDRQENDHFLRSLLAQMQASKQEILEPIRSLYTRYGDKGQYPGDKELLEALRVTLMNSGQTYIIIDAIDECAARQRLLDVIEEISKWDIEQLHLLATSRGESDIQDLFNRIASHQCCMDAAAVNDDIRWHVQESIHKDPRLKRWPPDVQDEIGIALTSKTGGMFRWADCQLRTLKKCKTIKGLRHAFNSLPATLDETYSRILDNVDPESATDTHRMLLWLCFSGRPLFLDEITEALAVDLESLKYDVTRRMEDPSDVLSTCGSLVTCNNGLLKLSHYSVKEYLMSSRILCTRQSAYFVSEHSAHICIAKTCLVYLRHFENSGQIEHGSGSWAPLFSYSLDYLSLHYTLANRIPELNSLVLDLIDGPRSNIFRWAWRTGVFPERIYGKDIDTLKARRQTAFYNAALMGSPELLEILLERGADINAMGGYLGTALTAAAYHGSHESVKFLLSRGADPKIQAGHYGTALHAAALVGGWLDIMEMLISHGADVNATGGCYGTVLSAAVESQAEAEALVRFLLKAGADPHLGDRWPTLPFAAAKGDEASVGLLLECGVDADEYSGRALACALACGHVNIARMLVAKGARLDTFSDGFYGGSFRAAMAGGLVSLKFLINENNADYRLSDIEGRTALHIAACSEDANIITYLLDLGLDATQQDLKGWSVFHYAALCNTPRNLKVLLKHINFTAALQSQGWSPLHLACRKNGPEALDLLTEAGFSPSTVVTSHPTRRWTLYDIAFAYGNRRLLSKDGTSKHRLLENDELAEEKEKTLPTPLTKAHDWLCDGCNFRVAGVSYGPRYRCGTCSDFDYCFMCNLSAEQTHPHPLIKTKEDTLTSSSEENENADGSESFQPLTSSLEDTFRLQGNPAPKANS